jgi:Flp pilus assembly pilin Flp
MPQVHEILNRVLVAARRFRPSQDQSRGASLVEYALLLSLLVIVTISAVTFFGNQTDSLLQVPPSSFS